MSANQPASKPLRVVQWTTGNVARQTVRAVMGRSDLELVGVFAHSPAKVGKDAAELCGLDVATGVLATDDAGALLSLEPDCVIYNALHFDIDEVAAILRSGANVVTSSEFLTGRALGADVRETLEAAAAEGRSSLFGSGMNPGFLDLMAGVAAGASLGVRKVYAAESVDVTMFAGDGNMDELGWGRPKGDPGHARAVEGATLVFRDGLEVLASMLGLDDYDVRCRVDFAHANHDMDLPGRPIPAGTVAGMDVRWEAVCDGDPVLELHQRWVMGGDIAPAMPVEHGWVIEITGDPHVRIKIDVWPAEDLESLTPERIHAIGMRITGLPVVNAIPYVCAAEPGIRTYADLPATSTNLSAIRDATRTTA